MPTPRAQAERPLREICLSRRHERTTRAELRARPDRLRAWLQRPEDADAVRRYLPDLETPRRPEEWRSVRSRLGLRTAAVWEDDEIALRNAAVWDRDEICSRHHFPVTIGEQRHMLLAADTFFSKQCQTQLAWVKSKVADRVPASLSGDWAVVLCAIQAPLYLWSSHDIEAIGQSAQQLNLVVAQPLYQKDPVLLAAPAFFQSAWFFMQKLSHWRCIETLDLDVSYAPVREYLGGLADDPPGASGSLDAEGTAVQARLATQSC